MKHDDLKLLHGLVEAKYQVRQQAFQSLLSREAALRNDLQKLEAQGRASESETASDMRAIGGDVIWKAWLGKARTSLNMQLALVLAEKEQHVRQVQQAYGKVLATEELMAKSDKEQRRQRQTAQLAQAIALSVIR
ncbi:hypothetical protein KX928_04180 [Roseobacter sp. YSTF-M11]|uniref:Flagellar FliJ protein n=1 Tax=Roseobacter insulae TaxID=2859783 RepID=A0A9X1JXH5_9RHOB|nr:hypothetical protein [Roseobacter insulae]MBW4706981.1 hypothetical protein [Roseobacter insulae]